MSGQPQSFATHDIEPPVSEEKKATFYATAELNVRCLFLELETKC